MFQIILFPVDDEKEAKKPELVPESVLAIIEEAYPNSLTIDDMSRRFKAETEIVRNMVLELVDKKLVKPVGAGLPGAAGLDSAAGNVTSLSTIVEILNILIQKGAYFFPASGVILFC